MAYDEKSIKILEGLEAVRKRPGMYIGSTDKRGLHHLVWEIVDNAVDEAINGYGSNIKVTITKEGSIKVKDEGRGVPVGIHESGKSTPEVIYTVLHAGGKFEDGGYKVSGGLHGVGASVVNALSKKMKVTINKDGGIYEITFKDGGKVDTPLKQIGTTRSTGTTVEFWPDETIFETTKFSYSTIEERLQESAFLISNLTIEVNDENTERSSIFHYENGLVSFVEYMCDGKNTLHKTLDISGEKNGIEVNIAMCYTDSYSENIISFVNNVKTSDGGTHEAGFKAGVTKVFNEYIKNNNLLKGKNTVLEGSDTREGLTAVISVNIPEGLLQFEGQTKGKLGTPQARSVVESIVYEKLTYFLEENKTVASVVLEKALKSKTAREAARKAREEARNGKSKTGKDKILNGKLTKAAGKDPNKNELFLVEGDSAGGSAKTGRNRETQAILPLRGKVLNCEKASSNDINANEELNLIIQTVGAGIGTTCNPSESNYGKIIIMTDADDDGAHIQILLLTFFYRFMKPLIEAGMIYVANPPLYSIEYGKTKEYIQTDEELTEKKKTIKGNYKVNRFKGLGEMDAEELFETTMDPKKRSLIKVSIEDAMLAEKRVSVLMGDKVDPRKQWIEENVDFTLEDDFRR
jgi:topoisomerase-4 subunit B